MFDIGAFAPSHYPFFLPTKTITQYGGQDITPLFPVQVSALCQGIGVDPINPEVTLDFKPVNISGSPTIVSSADLNAHYHDFRYFTGDQRYDWFQEQMIMLRASYKVGNIGYSAEYVATLATKQKNIAIMQGRVYDMTNYNIGGRTLAELPGQGSHRHAR